MRELLRQEIARDEGRRLISYQDSVKLWTIGVGHLLGKERRMTNITEAECDALFAMDLDEAERTARRIVASFDRLDEVRRRALVNMAFNLGGRLAEFRQFLAAVEAGDWNEASRQMMDSLWARQVGPRARRLEHMVRTGEVGGGGG